MTIKYCETMRVLTLLMAHVKEPMCCMAWFRMMLSYITDYQSLFFKIQRPQKAENGRFYP